MAHAVALYAARYRQPRVNPERVVLELTVEHAKTRVQFGQPIIEHQSIANMLAASATQ